METKTCAECKASKKMDAEAWAELYVLRAERGPSDGSYATWKEAAVAERLRRIELERELRALKDAENPESPKNPKDAENP